MYLDGSAISCGVNQLYHLDVNPKRNLKFLAWEIFEEDMAHAIVVWSDLSKYNSSGNKLYRYIRKLFPDSELLRSKVTKNPNSGNNIRLFSWRIPMKQFKRWFEKS